MVVDLSVTRVCDTDCFDLPEWVHLVRSDPDRNIFQTPEWNKLWWEEFSHDKEICVLTMEGDAGIEAIVPLYRKLEEGRRVLRFVGGIDLTDYLGPICSASDRARVARGLVRWLAAGELGWDEFDAHNMPVPFGFAEFLVDHADREGFVFKLEQEETSAVLPLPSRWDTYVASLDGKDRHELRRKLRRLEREHPDARVRTATPQSLERDLTTFVAMHRGAQGHKGHFLSPGMATFFTRVAQCFSARDWLRLDLLEVGDRALAATFSFELDGRFYLYNSAFQPEARRLSPGFVLVARLVRRAIEAQLKTFDFLRGPERYKYQLGAAPVPLNNVRILNQRA